MTGDRYDQSGNFGIGNMSGGTITGNAKIAGVINEDEIEPKAKATDAIDEDDIKRKILILAANPILKSREPLRLNKEVRDIEEGLRRASNRDRFVLKQSWAVRPRDFYRAMLDHNPQIVHFSGHGTGDDGLVFEDENEQAKLVDGEALSELFKLFAEKLECVVLNGCYSEVQAKEIVKHINYVVGMNQAIGDEAAINFAVGFYDALGAGRAFEFAYQSGCVAIQLAGIPEQLTPVLLKKSDLEAA